MSEMHILYSTRQYVAQISLTWVCCLVFSPLNTLYIPLSTWILVAKCNSVIAHEECSCTLWAEVRTVLRGEAPDQETDFLLNSHSGDMSTPPLRILSSPEAVSRASCTWKGKLSSESLVTISPLATRWRPQEAT